MPRGPRGEKRPADVIGAAYLRAFPFVATVRDVEAAARGMGVKVQRHRCLTRRLVAVRRGAVPRRNFLHLAAGAAALPLAARAQHPAMPVIGFLDTRSQDVMGDRLNALRRGLKETGCVEGENVTIVYRWAEGRYDRLPELATFKTPKTRHGRRTVTLPLSTITLLRDHCRVQQGQRLALGLGRAEPSSLVFADWDGSPRSPRAVTQQWRNAMEKASLTVTFHSLRHTHASTLIAAGLDVLTISRRLGHGSPAITLGIYGHLFKPDDRAAAIMETALTAQREG
jgi:integrase